MTTFTTLKGFNSFNDTDVLNEIQQTIIAFFDWGFINKGAFTNVYLSNTDINSNNQSILRVVHDPNYNNGQVWETFRHNLVWESGLATNTQPISISGVYINGSLKTSGTTGYEHYIDYTNGRVIFDTAINPSTTVKMEYSYKTILFDKISAYPYDSKVQKDSYKFTPGFTSGGSGDWSSLVRKQLPLVSVEVTPHGDFTPVSLGTGAQYIHADVLMHIFDNDDSNVLKLLSFIGLQKEKTIYRLDTNLIATSGAYALDYRGAKTSSPKSYADFIEGHYRHAQLYFEDAVITQSNLIDSNIYHGVVKFKVETICVV